MGANGFPDGRVPVLLSAHGDDVVAADADAILRYLNRHPEADVPTLAATLLRTRRLRRHRAVVRAADTTELSEGLRALAADDDHPLVARSSQCGSPRTAYVFPGQGNQWPSMGAEAYRELGVYRAEVDKCADAFVAAGVESPLPYLLFDTGPAEWPQIQTQAAQFTHAVGLARVWRSCGILPDITVGHSLGEIAAAYIAETIMLADATAVVVARAKVVDGLPGCYGMAVLGISPDDAEQLIVSTAGWLELSVVNAGSSVVVSGDRDAIKAVVAEVDGRGVFARDIAVNFPAHTSALEPLREELAMLLPRSEFVNAAAQFIGSATASVVAPGTDFGAYWYQNLRNTVRFDRAVAAALDHGATSFVEMSAHPALLFALGDLVGDGPGESPLTVGSGRRDEALVDELSANIAAAAVADPGYRWADLIDTRRPPLRNFPNSPMRAVHLWATPEPLPPIPGLTVGAECWELKADSGTRVSLRRVAVLDLAGPTGPLAGRLRDAVERHGGVLAVEPREADLVVAVAPVVDHPDAEQAADEITRLMDAGLLDYVDAAGPDCRDVWLITVGGEHVRADEPVALPAQAALAAMHRSLGYEHPDRTFRHLDLPSWEIDDDTAAAVVDTLLGDTTETALRESISGPTVYIRALPDAATLPEPLRLDAGLLGNVVITGGSGAVGLHYARYLAEHGARRIVLLSRRGVDPATVAEIAGVRGAEVLAPRCDLTSAEQVRAAAQELGADGASLVVHAAGAAAFAPRAELTSAAFADAAAAKIGGLARMVEAWPLRGDSRILVCSSVSGVWGGHGHAMYSAANRMLDVMAGQLRANGRHCVAVRWGLWQGSSIVDGDALARIERSGLVPMAPDAAIEASLRDHHGDPLIIAADRDRLRMFLDSRGSGESGPEPAPSGVDIAARVRAELAAALDLGDGAVIDLEAPLLDLGVDSLLALDLRKRLRKATGRTVPLAALLGGITGGELIASLSDASASDTSDKVETSRD